VITLLSHHPSIHTLLAYRHNLLVNIFGELSV
jgi:hypothetical protein